MHTGNMDGKWFSQEQFGSYMYDFTIVPQNTKAAFCLCRQCLLSLLFAVLVLLQIGYLGIIFPKESLLYARWNFILELKSQDAKISEDIGQ